VLTNARRPHLGVAALAAGGTAQAAGLQQGAALTRALTVAESSPTGEAAN